MAKRDQIGARVAALRKTRGWTARELARRAQVSYSLLAKAETGAVPASPAFIGAVARALGVDVTRITGQPYAEPGGAVLQGLVGPLRRALLAYDLPVGSDVRPRPAGALRAEVAAVSLLGRQARYLQLSQQLPGLLDELQVTIETADARHQPALYALLAEAYGGIAGLTHQLGYADLRALSLDRIEWASRRCGDSLRVARTQWSRGASLLGAGAYDHGLALMERTRGELGPDPARMDEAARSVYGSLHLRSAVLAARAGRRRQADAHLAEAETIAGTVSGGSNHYGMEFGPANVGLHRVSAAVEMADGTLAVSRAREVERAGHLGRLPAVRVGHYHIEVARGWLYHGDRHRALSSLRRARRVAPQQARYHPMVRGTVQAIAHAEPRPSEELRSFAAWLGIDSSGGP
jgi:transcriptional regulator with XRE-family HTH domain